MGSPVRVDTQHIRTSLAELLTLDNSDTAHVPCHWPQNIA
jgi:hypothetical protein